MPSSNDSELYAKQMHGSTISTRTEIVEDQKESLEAFCSATVTSNLSDVKVTLPWNVVNHTIVSA